MNGDGGCFAPTTDNDDSVYVIGHDDKGIQFNQREMVRDILPTTPGGFTRTVQPHFSIHDFAQKARPIPCADCHEIRPRMARVGARRAVPLPEADGAAMVFVLVKCHCPLVRVRVFE